MWDWNGLHVELTKLCEGFHTPQQTQDSKLMYCICIWTSVFVFVFEYFQVHIFVFVLVFDIFEDLVFVFVFDLVYLTPSLVVSTHHQDQFIFSQCVREWSLQLLREGIQMLITTKHRSLASMRGKCIKSKTLEVVLLAIMLCLVCW